MKSHLCTGCGEPHIIQQAHKETLTQIKCHSLKAAAALVVSTGLNRFKMRDITDFTSDPSRYNNFQKLRYHGLITQVKENGHKIRGEWLITRNGWRFLRGELELPKFVLVKDNHPLESGRSDILIGLLDVLRGADYLDTDFDYFDEQTGSMVARRPAKPYKVDQTMMLLDIEPAPRRAFVP